MQLLRKTLPLRPHHHLFCSLPELVPSRVLLFIQEVFFFPIKFGLCISESGQPSADHQYLVLLGLTRLLLRSLVVNFWPISDHF